MAQPQRTTPLWLSHHTSDQLCRCVEIFGFHVCARCLGLYPLLFALIGLEAAFRAPGLQTWDIPLAVIATLPALIDWGRGQFEPLGGSNFVRIASGVLLAFPLSRTLWIHAHAPLHPWMLAHLGWIFLSAVFILAAVRIRKSHQEALACAASPDPYLKTASEILAELEESENKARTDGCPDAGKEDKDNAGK